ncbi:MAG: MBL fold metallo-hydrolase [Acetobacter sp.]|nr:MBL fold metallo-hydrolase [Acetobacter sp.]
MNMTYPGMQITVIPVTSFRQNCSIVWDEATSHAMVVDPGGDVQTLLAFIDNRGLDVKTIVITHGHLDHAGGVTGLCRHLSERGKPVPEVIGPSQEDHFLLSSIVEQAYRFGLTDLENAQVDRYACDNDVLHIIGRKFRVIHVPGHTPGHIALVDQEARRAFVGDLLFRNTIGRSDFEYGDGPLLVRSIKEKLLPLGDDILFVPGHGGPSSFGVEREQNPFLIQDSIQDSSAS